MVAIVAGNGLGLERSSAKALGSRGQLGSAFLGRNGEGVTVNAATGNLIVQNTDEVLIGRGFDSTFSRTYNSLGAYTNLADTADPDNWLVSTQRKVKLTGTANAAGSTATLTDWDGSIVTFTYDAAGSSYKSGERAYLNQRITLAGNTFTLTDVTTRAVQTFDNAIGGRIVNAKDADGNTVSYTYDAATTAGKLTRVTTANSTGTQFNYTDLVYTGTNLTALTTSYYDTVSATNKTLTRTRYTYDAANRLSTVSVDLTPSNTADAVVYTTTYAYKDATSKLVTSITQSDGTSFAITYDASNRVATLAQTAATGVTRTTTFAYDTTNRVTTITDPLSNVYKMTYDTSARLTKVEEPAPTGGNPSIRTFEYDAAGNVIRALTFDNAANVGNAALAIESEVGRYDANGNLLERVDGANRSAFYTYGAFNEVLSETTYTEFDANGLADNIAPTGGMTVHYVYDDSANNLFNDDGTTYTGTNAADVAEKHLRFRISAEGRVTEYRYDANGLQTSQIDYAGTAYTGTTWTEAALATWVGTADKTQAQRTDVVYDFRGNLSTVTSYSATDAAGVGLTTQDWSRVTYVYDQFGKLLSKLVSGTNALGGEATAVAETFVYDGLGRVISSTDLYGQTTTVSINDGTRTTTISTPNDVTHTLIYSIAGELLSDAVSGTGLTTGTTSYAYDNLGRLRMTTDPVGVKTYFVYDKQNRLTATIDGDGSITEYKYDGADRRIATVSYATAVSAANLTTLGIVTTNTEVATIRPMANVADRWSWSIYNKAGQLVETIGAAGAVTTFAYDGAGRSAGSTQYATALTAAVINGADGISGYRTTPPVAQVLPAASAANDRVNRHFYDNDGLLIGTLDGDGYFTEILYDKAGRKTQTIAYTNAASSSHWASGTFAQLKGSITAVAASDIRNHWLYDGRGRVGAVIDGEGNVTRYHYTARGDLDQEIRGQKVTAATAYTLATLPAATGTLETTRIYRNAAGQVTSEVRTLTGGSQTTSYGYDSRGRLISQIVAETVSAETRTERFRYDVKGRLIGQLSGVGAATLPASPTDAQLIAAINSYGTTYTYDAADRLIQKVTPQGTTATGNKTTYYYDTDGQLRFEINALGEVTEYRYNVLEDRTDAIVYGARIAAATLATLTGGLINSTVTTAVSGLANTVLDSRTQYAYDNLGQLTREYNPLYVASPTASNYVTIAYNTFGDVSTVTRPTSNAAADVATSVYNRRGLLSYTNHLLNGSSLGAIQETFVYDAFGRVTSRQTNNREPLGETIAYDRAGRVTGKTNNYGQAQTFAYDARSNLISTTDRNGKITTFGYDLFNRAVTTTTAEGVVTTVKKNAYGQTIQVTDGASRSTSYTYDKNGNLKTVVDAASTTTNNYDNADRLIETIDAKGVVTRFTYDAASRVLTKIQDYGTGKLNLTTTYAYDAKGQQISVTDALNVVTTYVYDLKGQTTRVISDAGSGKLNITTDFIYGADGKVVWQTDAIGSTAERKTFFEYDSLGRVTRKTEDQGTGKLNVVTNYAYDVNGNLVAVSDNLARVTRYVYDKENRLVATVDAEGQVTENGYDGEGRVIWTRQYLTKLDPSAFSTFANLQSGANWLVLAQTASGIRFDVTTKNQATGVISTISSATLAWSAVGDRIERSIYDGDGRVAYVVDAEGYVVKNGYDAANNVIKTWRYAAAVSVTNTATKATLDGLVPAGDPATAAITTFTYDSANRLTDVTDATGTVTHFVLDALGQIIETHVAYGTADLAITRRVFDNVGRLTSETSAYGQPEAATISYGYNALGWVTSITNPRTFATTRTYDNLGRMLSETVPLDASNSATTFFQYDGRGNQVKIIDPRNNVGYFYYDGIDRLVLQVDPEGYVTETAYAIGSNVSSVKRYANKANNLGSVSVTVKPTVTASSADATTSFTYDKVDRLKTATDALSGVESYVYDGLGNRTSMTNKLGGVTAYAYDRRGLLVLETKTMSAYDHAGALIVSQVQTSYAYDARGNLITKIEGANVPTGTNMSYARLTTTYTYDKLDRLLTQIDPVLLGSTPVTSWQYDKRGNVILQTAADGGKTYSYYDDNDRQIAQVSPVGSLVTWSYDAAGNVIGQKAYSIAISPLPASAGGTPPTGSGTVRETQLAYDRNNRLIQTTTVNVRTGAFNGSSYVTAAGQNLASHNQYDAAGNLIKETDARGAAIYHYYDKNGREIAKVDQEGFITTWTRDTNGNVLSETRFANRFTGTPVEGGTPPTVSVHGEDRTTSFTYDKMGRRLTETRAAVGAYTVSASGGLVTDGTAATVTYTYNALGEVLSKRESTGDKAEYQYDLQGRLERQLDAVTQDFNGGTLRHVTYFYYDANNNLVRTVERAETAAAAGGASGTTGSYASGYGSGDDRVTRFGYDARSLRWTIDAADRQHYYWYDVMGRRTYDYYQRANSAGAIDGTNAAYDGNLTSYDLSGRVISQYQANYNSSGAWVTNGPVTQFGYNAFGEVVTRSVGGYVQESFDYDNAGRVVKTTGGDGIQKFVVYDTNGNATLLLQSNGRNMAADTVDSALAYVGAIDTMTVADVVATITVYDKRNMATTTREPQRRIANSADVAATVLQTLVRSRGYNAFGEVTFETDARNNTTNYYYNTMGRLTQKQNPFVNVTNEAGGTGSARPTENYAYDVSGRLVGVQNANGFWTTRTLLGGSGYEGSEGKLLKEFRPDTAIVETRYDAFGNARTLIDGIGRVTSQVFDKANNLIQVTKASGRVDYFAYDVLGQRVKHWTTAYATPNYGSPPLITPSQPIYGPAPIINDPVYGEPPIIGYGTYGEPIYGPAPIIGYGDPIYGPAPVIDPGGQPIYGTPPVIDPGGQPIYGPAPIINDPVYGEPPIIGYGTYGEPIYGPAPIVGYGDPVYGPAPVIDPGGQPIYGEPPIIGYGMYGEPIYGEPPIVGYTGPTYGPAPVVGGTGAVYGPAPIIGYTDPTYGPAPIIGYTGPTYGPAPIIGYTGPVYGPAPIIGYTAPVYGPAPLLGYTYQYETTDYDIAGRVTKTVNFAGDTSTFAYAWTNAANGGMGLIGGWTRTANLANGHTSAETADYFGRMLSRTDMGGRTYTFNYDRAGQLVSQTSTAGQSIAYTYYNTGKMATMADNAGVASGYSNSNIDGTYTYDADGNRTYEKLQGTSYYYDIYSGYTSSYTITLQEGRGSWDGMNRLITFTDAGAAGNGSVSVTNSYDAVGNVRRTYSVHNTINNDQTVGAQVTDDYWYKYDAMNRMTLVKGGVSNGAIVRNKDESRSITYDLAGQRASEARTVTVPPYSDPYVSYPGYVYESRENFGYNLEGLLTATYIATGASSDIGTIPVSAGTGGALRSQTSYDAAGRVTNALEYATDGTTVQYNRYDIVYDWRDNVQSEKTSTRRYDNGSLYVYNSTVTYTYNGTDETLTSVGSVNERLLNGSSWQDVPDTLTSYVYVWWDGPQQSTITYKPNTSAGTTYGTDLYYDANGHLTSAYVNDGRPRSVTYINDANGQVMVRREQDSTGNGDPKQVWWYFDGKQVGTTGNNGNADPDYEAALNERVTQPGTGPFRLGSTYGTGYSDFDQAFNALSPGEGGGAGTVYTVRNGDTLDGIARMMFGDASLWYMIADANGLSGASRLTAGQQIRIPSQLANVHNTSDTFRPYDTAAHIGDIQPTTPAPPAAAKKKGCGVFGAIILAIVAIAVVVVTAGAAIAAATPGLSLGGGITAALGGTATLGAGAGALAGTAFSGGLISTFGVAGGLAIGAGAAALGSIVSQGVGVATGLQDKFSWKAVGLAALGGAVGAAVAPGGAFGQNGLFGAAGSPGALGTINNVIVRAAANGVVGNALSQGLNLATGLQKKFDWTGVAAAGISAAVGAAGTKLLTKVTFTQNANGDFIRHASLSTGAHVAAIAASDVANAATRSLIEGTSFRDNLIAALPNTITQTLGAMITGNVTNEIVIRKDLALAYSTSSNNLNYVLPTRQQLESRYGVAAAQQMLDLYTQGTGTVVDANGRITMDPVLENYLRSSPFNLAQVGTEQATLMQRIRSGDINAYYDFNYAPNDPANRFDLSMTQLGDDNRAINLVLNRYGIPATAQNVQLLQQGGLMRQRVAYPANLRSEFRSAQQDLRSFDTYRTQFVAGLARASLAVNALANFATTNPSYAGMQAATAEMRAAIDQGYFTLRPFTSRSGPASTVYMAQWNAGAQSDIAIYRESFGSKPKAFGQGILHEIVHSAVWQDRVYSMSVPNRRTGPSTPYNADARTYYSGLTARAYDNPVSFVTPGSSTPPTGAGPVAVGYGNVNLYEDGAVNWYVRNVLRLTKLNR